LEPVNTREAVTHLSDRARRTARGWYAGGAIAMLLGGVVLTLVLIPLEELLLGVSSLKLPLLIGFFSSASIVAPVTRGLLRKRLTLSRPRWIEDVARVEGLNAKELEQFFTLDSW
jgi:hypothetical protein